MSAQERFPQTPEELRAFVQAEVRKALHDVARDVRVSGGIRSARLPDQRLPKWARQEETGVQEQVE